MAAAAVRKHGKTEKYGIEVPNRLTYNGWEPGGTYTKSIVLKNVKIKSQKIKFRISSSEFFSAVYPQPVMLSAGNSYSLPVTFRPLEKNEYEDQVVVETSDGVFTVPVKAVLSKPHLSLPTSLKFGVCAVSDCIELNFTITNTGTVATDYHWECSAPFQIMPAAGYIDEGESCRFMASYCPVTASVHTVTAVCHHGNDYLQSKVMKLEGTGKYPHLLAKVSKTKKLLGDGQSDEIMIAFGDVSVGQTSERTIELINTTPVPAQYSLSPSHDTAVTDPVFTYSQTQGVVSPLDTLDIKVFYSPSYSSQMSTMDYTLSTRGGLATTKFCCSGQARGPMVTADNSVVDFGIVECGQTSSAVVHLSNSSPTSTVYKLQVDSQGIFHTESLSGEVGGNTHLSLTLHFTPRKPIPYHREILCLIDNQEPITLDVIGSSYSETVRPVQLTPHHITLYQSMSYSGLSKLPPEHLQQAMLENTLVTDEQGMLVPTPGFDPPLSQLAPTVQQMVAVSKFARCFKPDEGPHISCDTSYIEFGYTVANRLSKSRVVTVTNHTQGTVHCSWMAAKGEIFQVVPPEREISPDSAVAFAVSFKPDSSSQIFSKELECYIFYKALHDYSLVDTRVVVPPWCITISVTGHSFHPHSESFLPSLTWSQYNIVFPSTVSGQAQYRTVASKNCGETPVLYHFNPDPTGIFEIMPPCGVIYDGHQLFLLKMVPKATELYKHVLECQFNDRDHFKQELLLSGIAESPQIQMDSKSVYFKPTCVGNYSESYHTIRNTCELPIRVVWQMKDSTDIVRTTPTKAIINPHEKLTLKFQFIPKEVKRYSFSGLLVSVLEGSGGTNARKTKTTMKVKGEGAEGEIICTNPYKDCGAITIGLSRSHTFTLTNKSLCSLSFKLAIKQVTELDNGEKEEVPLGHKPHGVELGFSESSLIAGSSQSLFVTLRPYQPAIVRHEIFYHLTNPLDGPHHKPQWLPLCSISMQGVYPTCSVVDVKGEGCPVPHSMSHIWRLLQIDRLNQYLNEDPSLAELRYAISTRHSITRKVPVLTRAISEFNFGAAPLNPESKTTYYLLLKNTGLVPTQWAFQFPTDLYLEPEYWAETGKMDPIERHELDAVKNKLFCVSPKRGLLQIGETIVIRCSFERSHLGHFNLPVQLKLQHGRELQLMFVGITNPPGIPYIHFTSHVHTFKSVVVGSHVYPKQMFELHNAGDTMEQYTIDTTELGDMRKANYDVDIIKCLAPSGELPGGKTTYVPFIFSPAEAKTYSVDLPIHFSSGNTVTMTFTGEGTGSLHRMTTPDTEQSCSTIPLCSSLSLPNQLAELSQERFVLGDIPLFSVIRYTTFLRNTSSSIISYQWQVETEQTRDVISFHPRSGILRPECAAVCRMTFHSLKAPEIYNLDIACKITNESEMTIYKRKLRAWENSEEEMKHSFIISDHQGSKSLYKPGDTNETYDDWKNKNMSVKPRTRARLQKQSKTNNECPVPPKAQYLHLAVTGSTYSIPDYCSLHDDFDSYTIDYQSLLMGATHEEPFNKGKVDVSLEETDVVTSTLLSMLRNLLNDSNFQSALRTIIQEPIPVFSQFSTKTKPQSTSTTEAHEDASRHVYASGLEGLPSSAGLPDKSDGASGSQVALTDASVSSIFLPEPPPPITVLDQDDAIGQEIKHLPEFGTLVENISENVLLNIVSEILAGELNPTAPLYTISKPPDT